MFARDELSIKQAVLKRCPLFQESDQGGNMIMLEKNIIREADRRIERSRMRRRTDAGFEHPESDCHIRSRMCEDD